MVANIGREIALLWGGSAIEGVREKSVAMNGEPIDITSDDDDGWRALLTEAGESSVEIGVSGVTKSTALRQAYYSNDRMKPIGYTWPEGDSIAGEFFLASYSETGNYKDAITWEGTLQSSGEVTYTPAAAPVNTVLPAISGTAQVGVALTALTGVWTGAVSFAYQWKNEGAAISGAVSSTYTPVTGDLTENITVTVTATNGAGSTSATSAETLPVIAA